jgi:hypothetical protein
MNERIRELWSQAGGHYNSGNQHTWPEYTIDDPEKFAELIRAEHTQSVINLCANTINNNLNNQARRKRNNYEVLELIVIVGAMIAWITFWYTQFHMI